MGAESRAEAVREALKFPRSYIERQAKHAKKILDLMSEDLFENPASVDKAAPVMQFLAKIVAANEN